MQVAVHGLVGEQEESTLGLDLVPLEHRGQLAEAQVGENAVHLRAGRLVAIVTRAQAIDLLAAEQAAKPVLVDLDRCRGNGERNRGHKGEEDARHP